MGTIAEKLNYLNTTKTNIKNAIIAKGVTVETTDTFRDYATRISEITDGSVEELTVTENGTYTGTEGVTYNPVNVNLPLGSKSVTANGTYTASDDSLQGYSEVTVDIDDTDLYRDTTDSTYESVKTLSNCGAFPMLSLKVGIEPIQEGSGDPSPTNIRPISGWDEVNVTVADDVDNPTVSNVYTIDLDGTRYGGTLDVVSGELVVDRASIKLNDLNWTKQNTASGNWRFISSQSIQNIKIPTDASWKIDNLCSVYQNVTANETWTAEKTGIAINADGKLLICDLNQADTTALGVVIANQTYCYELATPQTYQLTPTQVKSLLGTNNVWADTGDVGDVRYFKKVEL